MFRHVHYSESKLDTFVFLLLIDLKYFCKNKFAVVIKHRRTFAFKLLFHYMILRKLN